MRQYKGAGGLKSISTNVYQVTMLISFFPICYQPIDLFDDKKATHGSKGKPQNKRGETKRSWMQLMRSELHLPNVCKLPLCIFRPSLYHVHNISIKNRAVKNISGLTHYSDT